MSKENFDNGGQARDWTKEAKRCLKRAGTLIPGSDKEGNKRLDKAIEKTEDVEKHFEKVLGDKR